MEPTSHEGRERGEEFLTSADRKRTETSQKEDEESNDTDSSLDVDKEDEYSADDSSKTIPFKFLSNGLISCKKGRILVPKTLRESVLQRYHTHQLASHQGVTKTLVKLRAGFKFPKMGNYVWTYIAKCLICAKRKCHGTQRAPMKPLPATDYVGEQWAMDICGPIYPVGINNNKYIIVFCEYTTRYVKAAPMMDQTAHTIAEKFIEKIILRHGTCKKILTDRGTNLGGHLMENLYETLGIKHIKSSSYRAQSDGVVERHNRSIGDMLASYCRDNPSDWEKYLKYVIFSYSAAHGKAHTI